MLLSKQMCIVKQHRCRRNDRLLRVPGLSLTTGMSQLHIRIIVLNKVNTDEIRYCMSIELWLDKTGFCSDIHKYIYVYIYMHIYIYVHTHTHTHTHIYIYVCVCVCVTALFCDAIRCFINFHRNILQGRMWRVNSNNGLTNICEI
jgi:hypothetical protein